MAQKIFEPFKKIPQQIQNFHFMQKLHDLTIGKGADSFASHLSSVYGCIESPTSFAFDNELGLLAAGSKTGIIKIYGSAGIVFTVHTVEIPVCCLHFLPNEGRLVAAFADGYLELYELDTKSGIWNRHTRLNVVQPEQESITSLALGDGVLYVGSSIGTLRQVVVKSGRMYLGDDTLTSCTSAMVAETVSLDKRNELGVDSSIVSLAVQPGGNHLLIAYAGGCVAVAIPQPLPETNTTEPRTSEVAPTAEVEPTTPNTEEPPAVDAAPTIPETNNETAAPAAEVAPTQTATEGGQSPVTGTPAKEGVEKRATLKLKALTRSLRGVETTKSETETEPPLPVPPAPRISHLLLRDQPVESATWRVTAADSLATEVVIAYGDGAFQVWPIVATVSQQPSEPIIVSKRDPPSTPYGPLPCGAIKKILVNPGVHGGMLTAFIGGLPRPEFQDRHAVSIMQGQDHHVCFQFGSEVKDFMFIPSQSTQDHTEEAAAVSAVTTEEPVTRPSRAFDAAAMLVLTERELLAIDLTRPDWPAFQLPYMSCLDLSPVTAITHVCKVPSALLDSVRSELNPIWGGAVESSESNENSYAYNDNHDVAILGHANGWITMLVMGRGDSVYRIGTLHTASLFNIEDTLNAQKCATEEETWPPFRRVGYCALAHAQCVDQADPRLAVTQLAAHIHTVPGVTSSEPNAISIVAGGAGGHVSIWTVGGDPSSLHKSPVAFEPDVARIHANLFDAETSGTQYTWKGPAALRPFEGVTQLCDSDGIVFTPHALIQLNPPAPVTALAWETSWNLLAIGSPYGFAVIDLLAKSTIHVDLFYGQTLPQKIAHTVATVQRELVNRGKQFTSSMRQSFRRLKHLRTSLTTPSKATDASTESQGATAAEEQAGGEKPVTATDSTEDSNKAPVAEEPEHAKATAGSAVTDSTNVTSGETDTTTAAVEPEAIDSIALSPEEFGPSTVRSVLFADTFIVSPVAGTGAQATVTPAPRTPSLWVGTANGRAIAYELTWDGTQGPVTVTLRKELQLQHHAPIIGMCIIDATTRVPISQSSRSRTSCEPAPKPPVAAESEEVAAQQPTQTTEAEQAPAPTPTETTATAAAETHLFLLCSEEQVKIFNLPSLRALHKHKFIDRIRLPYGAGHITLTSDSTSSSKPETEAANETDQAAAAVADNTGGDETKVSPAPAPAPAPAQPHRKTLSGFGVQCFTRGTPDQPKSEWAVVVVRHDCKGAVLSIPHLRQQFKLRPCVSDSGTHRPIPFVASHSNTNLVLWQSGPQLMVNELCLLPRLSSPACVVPGTRGLPVSAPIVLPDWARPKPTEDVSGEQLCKSEPAAAANAARAVEVVEVVEPVINGHDAALEQATAEVTEPYIEPTVAKSSQSFNSSVPHAGDVTMDSIKEYLNGEGTITVKTFESSTEKHTLVEGGQIVTTLHETEKVDGKIVKDDVVKFTSEGEVTVPAVSDST